MLHIALIVGAAYLAIALIAYLLVLPLLRGAKIGDRVVMGSVGGPGWQPPTPDRSAQPTDGRFSRSGNVARARVELAYGALALDRLTLQAATLLGAEEACLVLRDTGTRPKLTVVAQHGLGVEALGEHLPEGHELAIVALSESRPVTFPGGRFSRPSEIELELGPGIAAATPISWHGAVRGALSVRTLGPAARVSRRELELLAEIAGLAGLALEHRRRRELTNADTNAEVRLLLDAVSRSDPYSSRHADDVAELARWVGAELGLDRVAAYELEVTAALHDVGKMRVPLDILHAPRSLTEAEQEVMGMHPVWSFEIVAAVPGLEAVAPLVRAHHERWDGAGYPDGLAGRRIPLPSRIVAACDAIGALTTDRPYRRSTSIESAVEEISRCSGTQFDPEVVSVLQSGIDQPRSRELALAR